MDDFFWNRKKKKLKFFWNSFNVCVGKFLIVKVLCWIKILRDNLYIKVWNMLKYYILFEKIYGKLYI